MEMADIPPPLLGVDTSELFFSSRFSLNPVDTTFNPNTVVNMAIYGRDGTDGPVIHLVRRSVRDAKKELKRRGQTAPYTLADWPAPPATVIAAYPALAVTPATPLGAAGAASLEALLTSPATFDSDPASLVRLLVHLPLHPLTLPLWSHLFAVVIRRNPFPPHLRQPGLALYAGAPGFDAMNTQEAALRTADGRPEIAELANDTLYASVRRSLVANWTGLDWSGVVLEGNDARANDDLDIAHSPCPLQTSAIYLLRSIAERAPLAVHGEFASALSVVFNEASTFTSSGGARDAAAVGVAARLASSAIVAQDLVCAQQGAALGQRRAAANAEIRVLEDALRSVGEGAAADAVVAAEAGQPRTMRPQIIDDLADGLVAGITSPEVVAARAALRRARLACDAWVAAKPVDFANALYRAGCVTKLFKVLNDHLAVDPEGPDFDLGLRGAASVAEITVRVLGAPVAATRRAALAHLHKSYSRTAQQLEAWAESMQAVFTRRRDEARTVNAAGSVAAASAVTAVAAAAAGATYDDDDFTRLIEWLKGRHREHRGLHQAVAMLKPREKKDDERDRKDGDKKNWRR